MEYAPRCDWNSTSDKVCVQLLDRKQQRLLLVSIDIKEFYEEKNKPNKIDNLMSGIQILKEDKTNIWINVRNFNLNYLKKKKKIFNNLIIINK